MVRGLVGAGLEFVVVGGVAARAHGATRVTEDLDICYARTPEIQDRLAALLSSWHAYPRGIDPGLPFIMDRRTLDHTMMLTLTTDEGDLDLLDRIEGVGDYAMVRAEAVMVDADGGLSFPVLGLEPLVRAKRATGRRKDRDQLPELEALLERRAKK
jgi:predicted nucleotidyltransferase